MYTVLTYRFPFYQGKILMVRRKVGESKVAVGNITDVSGEVNIAAGDIYKGFTTEQVSVLIKQITSTFQPKPFDGRCPYKGLDVFEEEDAELFFGRERLVNELVGRVKESQTVFITGPSGSGKSSLVRAGLIHALKHGAIKNLRSERWLYETMKPGREPLKELALAFSRLKSPELANYFQAHASEANILNECVESVLSGSKMQRLILFIDQFEEVFTQINREEERQAFINMLAHAGTVENGRVIVLFAMRSDFLSNCAVYPQLNDRINQSKLFQIGAMQPDELVSAIAQPALRVGLRIDPDLIAQIINDMQGEPGALPLMQFALKDLFDAQQVKGGIVALTLSNYLEHGGIRQALERHADASLAKLSENEQGLARSIFSGLIEIGRGTQDTKRTALFDELVPTNVSSEDVLAIVQKLADARLIITDEQAGKDTVSISHEKLIDAWPWLKKLVNENRDVIALQNEIAADAKEWEEHKRDASYLYSGGRLSNVREQLEKRKLGLSHLALDFVRAGRVRQQRARAALISVVSIVLIAAILASILFFNQAQRYNSVANTAQAAQIQAEIETRRATAGQLALEAKNVLDKYPQRALLLALESIDISHTANEAVLTEAEEALRLAYQQVSGIGLAGFAYEPTYVQFTKDGKWLAAGTVGGVKGEAHIWNVAKAIHDLNYQPFVVTFPVPENEDSHVYLSPHDVWFVADSQSQGASIWKTDVENEARAPILFEGSIKFIGAEGDSIVIEQQSSRAITWRVDDKSETRKEIQSLDGIFLAASADGRYVIVDDPAQGLQVWDTSAPAAPLLKIRKKGSLYKSAFFDQQDRWLVLIDEAIHPDIQVSVYNRDTRESEIQVWRSNNIFVYSLANLSAPPFSFALNGAAAKLPIISPDGLDFINFLSFPPLKNGRSASSTKVGYLNLRNEIPEYKIFDNEIPEYKISDVATLTPSFINNDWVLSDQFLLDRRDGILFTDFVFTDVDRDSNGNVIFSPDGKYILMNNAKTQLNFEELDKSHRLVLEPRQPVAIPSASPAEFAQLLKDNPKALGLEASVAISAVSMDHHWIAAGTRDGEMRLWNNLAPWDAVKIRPENYPSYIALSNDNHWLALGKSLWQLEEGKPVKSHVIDEKPDITLSISTFSPDSRWLLSLTDVYNANDYTFDVRAVLTDLSQVSDQGISQTKEIGSFFFQDMGGVAVQFSADNRWVAVYQNDAYSQDNEVNIASTSSFLYDLVNRKSYPLTSDLYQVEFMTDNQHVVLSSGSYNNKGFFIGKNPEIWSLPAAGGELTKVAEVNATGRSLISNDGHWLIMFPADAKTNQSEQLWDLQCAIENNKCEPQTLKANRAVFSPDAKYLLTGLDDGKNLVYDVWDLKFNPPSKILSNSTISSRPEISKTAEWIIFGDSISSGGTAGFLSNPNDGNTTFDGYASIYFSTGGRGGGDGALGSYHTDYFVTALNAAHAQNFMLRGHESGVSEIQISPNEQYILTFSGDIDGNGAHELALRLWDMNAIKSDPNTRAVVLPWNSDYPAGLAFSPNSEWIYVVGNHADVLYYYPKSIEQLQAQACKAVGRNFIINEWERYFPNQEYRKTCENLPIHQSALPVEPETTPLPSPTP
jgi:conflict system STAND superfamily ATPase/WD40 domain-containing protein